MTIVNDDSRVVNKLEAALTDNARVVIYDHHMFIVPATGTMTLSIMTFSIMTVRKTALTLANI